jgi:tetratricopeptide (TPR) repeat protein
MSNLRLIITSIFVCGVLAIDSAEILSIKNLKTQANILADNGDVNIALTVYLNILEQEESIYEPFNVKLAHTLNHIGELYISIGEEGISQVYIQRAITIYEYKIIETQKQVRLSLSKLLKSQIALGDSAGANVTKSRLIAFEKLDNPYLVRGLTVHGGDEDFSEEDSAIELVDLASTYLDRGLYSQAAEKFSTALLLQSSNLDLDYFEDFMVGDSLQQQELMLAFQEIKFQDSLITGANFYLSLIYNNRGDSPSAQTIIKEYIIENPTDYR